jgi:hypothetical protein
LHVGVREDRKNAPLQRKILILKLQGVSAMNYCAILLCWVLFLRATVSFAQEPSGRIDLDVVSGSPTPTLFVARIAFVEGDSLCPEDRGNLRISRGTLTQIRMTSPADPRLNSNGRVTIAPIDDETQQYQIESPNCRMNIAVRQQVRRDGSWTPLLVPRAQRPSAPLQERREIERQFSENLLEPREVTPAEKERAERFGAAHKARYTAGSLGVSVGTLSMGFPFDDRPQTCFEAAGDYQIERTGIIFSFLTGLPGDLNRFVIERTDLDANRSRLYFVRGDCRFELTVSQSVLRDGQWVSLPLAPSPLPKG